MPLNDAEFRSCDNALNVVLHALNNVSCYWSESPMELTIIVAAHRDTCLGAASIKSLQQAPSRLTQGVCRTYNSFVVVLLIMSLLSKLRRDALG